MKHQRGFTLAEMLVALSVAALLVTLAYGSVRIGIRSWEAADARSNLADAQRISWLYLHQVLSDARPVGDPRSAQGKPLFSGSPDQITFAADMPSYLNLGGLYVLHLGRNDKGQVELTRTLFAEYRQTQLESRVQKAVIVEEPADVKIRYFGQLDESNEARWHAEWRNQLGLPALIRVDISLSDNTHWPSLIAHPRIGHVQSVDEDDPDLDVDP